MGAVDIILDVGPASQPADSIYRDSIHFGLGLPAGWEVISAKACPAPHFRPARASVNHLDTNFRNQLIQDTLLACESRAIALGVDPGVRMFLKGRTIRANASPDSMGKPFNVKTDTVPQWFGFGGRIDISVPAGSPADTVLDTTSFKALPVYIYLSLKAPDRDTTARLIFFSKTGRLDTSVFASSSNQDRGALVYRPIVVGNPVSLPSRVSPAAGRALSVARSGPGILLINLPAHPGSGPAALWHSLEIRNSAGAVLRSWPGPSLSGRASLAWNGEDAAGRPLPAGRYVLVLTGWQAALAQPFPLLP